MKYDFWYLGGLGLSIFILIAIIIGLLSYDSDKWEAFKTAHSCKAAKVRGDAFNTLGVDSKGSVVIGIGSTPDKIGWLCDDGIIYYR